jgi:hypothetical protein
MRLSEVGVGSNEEDFLVPRPSENLELSEQELAWLNLYQGYAERKGKHGLEWLPRFPLAFTSLEIKIITWRTDRNTNWWTPTTFPIIVPSQAPVSSSKEGVLLDLKEMEDEKFYEVEYEGEKFAVRLADDGTSIETYEVEEADKPGS